jgi:hypothetical protein
MFERKPAALALQRDNISSQSPGNSSMKVAMAMPSSTVYKLPSILFLAFYPFRQFLDVKASEFANFDCGDFALAAEFFDDLLGHPQPGADFGQGH